MKKISLFVLCSLLLAPAARAADVTLYYSPTCPHCHHAMGFLKGELAYEYPTINIGAYNLGAGENVRAFQDALKKCKFESGGVPVIVIGEKCFQGYADFMKQELRDAAAVGLSDADKKAAEENVKLLAANPEKFRADNAGRANALKELTFDGQKKTESAESGSARYFYGFLIILVLGLGFVLLRKKKK
jgi:glutaredoxin